MPRNISKAELNNFSLFSLCSPKYGYGHFKRLNILIKLIKDKNSKFNHFSFDKKNKSKTKFVDLIKKELLLNKKVILDISNNHFLSKKIIIKLKKNIINYKLKKIYIIDSPLKNNLSLTLKLSFLKCFIPFEVSKDVGKKLSFIKRKLVGINYFICLKKKKLSNFKNKKFKILLSFGASDNFKGTLYVLELLKNFNFKKKYEIKVVVGKFFKK